MRTLVLVNPPNHATDHYHLAPPLGLLLLMKVAGDLGWQARLVDLNLPAWAEAGSDPANFYRKACSEILRFGPSCIALTSMGVNSHVALEICREIKDRDRGCVTLVGGVHLSSIAKYFESDFAFVDHVFVGESEASFERFLRSFGERSEPRVQLSLGVNDFAHPMASYGQIALSDYFQHNSRRLLDYEAGRGCKFRCSFCYSPAHYQSVRDLSPARVAAEVRALADLGAAHLFFVQDNFLNDTRWARSCAAALQAEGCPVRWNGYGTIPQLTPELAKALAQGGCTSLYMGIDAISETQKVSFNKRFYRGDALLLTRLCELKEAGIEPLCAFIVDAYKWDEDEIESVLRTAAACASIGAPIRINTFTRYPSSGLAQANSHLRPTNAKVRLMMDCPRVVEDNPLVARYPHLFPFHVAECPIDVWETRLNFIRMAQVIIQRYPDGLRAIASGPQNRLMAGFWSLFRSEEAKIAESAGDWKSALAEVF